MNKFSSVAIMVATGLCAFAAGPSTVQGYPYSKTRANLDPDPIVAPEDFDISQIEFWAGEGEKRCAVVIQWNVADEEFARVFGYKWDGDATGSDALLAIVKDYPNLYGSFTEGSYGMTVNCLGWDADNSGDYTLVYNGTTYHPDANGYFTLTPEQCDDATPGNADDWYRGGWYSGYWSYWTRDASSGTMGYSQVGAAGRTLVDGCIDGWMFAPGLETGEWKKWQPAAALGSPDNPDPVDPDPVDPSGKPIRYLITSDVDGARTVCVTFNQNEDYSDYRANREYYSGEIIVPETVTIDGVEYTVTSIGENAFREAYHLTSVTLPETISAIGYYCFAECPELKTVNVPAHVSEVAEGAFRDCPALENVTGCKNITRVDACAFMGCPKLTRIEGLTRTEHLGEFAFAGDTRLADLPVMPQLKEIERSVFEDVVSLKTLVIPSTIGDEALGDIFGNNNTGGVTMYSCSHTPPTVMGVYNFCVRYFNDDDEVEPVYAPVYVPFGCTEAYKKELAWGRCELRELTPDYYLTDEAAELDEDGDFIFNITVDSDYYVMEDDIPELFLQANDFEALCVRKARLLRVEYRKKGTETSKKLIASTDGNIAFATFLSPEPGVYEYRWINTADDEILTTDWTEFTIEDESEPEPGTAFFNFGDPYTLDPRPTDSDWVKKNASTNSWYVAGLTFKNNGVTLSTANGNKVDSGFVTAIDNYPSNSSSMYNVLYLCGTMTLTAPDGYSFKSIRAENEQRWSTTISKLNITADQPGTIEVQKTAAPWSVTWNANPDRDASAITFNTGSGLTEGSSSIARLYVTLQKTGISSGIKEITIPDGDCNADNAGVYYNLQGIPVANPVSGIYILRTPDGKIRKLKIRN